MTGHLQNISLPQFRLLLNGAGILLLVAIISLAVVPKVRAYNGFNSEVLELQQASQDSDGLEQHLHAKHAEIEELKFRLHGDMANLPVKEVEAYIIGRLQRISWRNDVEFVSVEPETGERVQVFREFLFNVQLIGEYDDLYHWLWEARNELGFVVVKEYSLQRRDQNDKSPRLLADLSLASYRVEQ